MKLTYLLPFYAAAFAELYLCTHGVMFDFHLIEEYDNCTNQEIRCKELGYDGLAVLSTPEAYTYAKNVIDGLGYLAYIGVHFDAQLNISLWNDATPIRSDALFRYTIGSVESPFGCMLPNKKMTMHAGDMLRPALCGNYKNFPSESSGSTTQGKLQTTSETVLAVVELHSYLECAIFCGTIIECRAAEFDPGLVVCTILGTYTSTGTLPDSQVLTYIRVTY